MRWFEGEQMLGLDWERRGINLIVNFWIEYCYCWDLGFLFGGFDLVLCSIV